MNTSATSENIQVTDQSAPAAVPDPTNSMQPADAFPSSERDHRRLNMALYTLQMMADPGDVVEIRCLSAGGRGNRTDSGYFDDFKKAAGEIRKYFRDGTRGIYFTLNRVNPALLARSANHMTFFAKHTTSDGDITARRWLYIDLDPVRPAGISSSQEELQAAKRRADEVFDWLKEEYFAEPIVACSGNGYHLQFPIDLPNDPASLNLVKGILKTLSQRFSDNVVKIDESVANAARIVRLYGTAAMKGDSTADRPHRTSILKHVPDYIARKYNESCDIEALKRVSAMSENRQSYSNASVPAQSACGRILKVEEYLQAYNIPFSVRHDPNGYTKYVLETCPFDSNHKSPDSMVSQSHEGALAFKCFHDSCGGYRWQDFTQRIGQPRAEHWDCTESLTEDLPDVMPGITPKSLSGRVTESPCFHPGQRVKCGDRANIGTVVEDCGDEVTVHFVSPEGVHATKNIPRNLVVPINGSIFEQSTAVATFSGESAQSLWPMADAPIDWLIENVFSADQPTIFGAKQKSLKTTLLTDLAVAVASGYPWLGRYNVPRKRKVLFISGESSQRSAIRKIRTAAEARNLAGDDIGDSIHVEAISFPSLPSPEHCLQIRRDVEENGFELVILDPLYMGLQGVNTTNLTEVGPALRQFMQACRPAACVIAHHVKKTANYGDAPDLEDLSQAGIAEFAGNYWLMGRMSEYRGDGLHEIAVRYGGRDEQFGLLKLDFDERNWKAEFSNLIDYREDKKQRKENEKVNDLAAKILEAVRECPDGRSENSLAQCAGTQMNREPFRLAIRMLKDRKAIISIPDFLPPRSRKTCPGWKLSTANK